MSTLTKPLSAARAARSFLRAAPAGALAAAAVLAPGAAHTQTLARQVQRAPDGVVRFQYDAAPGVFGAEDDVIIIRRDGGVSFMRGSSSRSHWNRLGDLDDCACRSGPVRVALRKDGGVFRELDMAVGGDGPAMSGAETDLGAVAPQDAADYLLTLAAEARERVARDAIVAATLGDDVTLWPGLVRLARNHGVDQDVRENAIFWLGQEAGDQVVGELQGLALDDEEEIDVRKRAIFSLSQHEGGDVVTTLIDLARSERLDPRLRKHAMFWLAQHDDERVIDFFERILSG